MFLYFAYGSNLFSKRIHLNNPSAVREGTGKLVNYRLDFVSFSKYWGGAISTIVPTKDKSVWGAIWQLEDEDLHHLDRQEGVHHGSYIPMDVDIILPNGSVKSCRVYQHHIQPQPVKLKDLPDDRRPSPAYLTTILKGASESNLPDYYQNFLKTIPDNGNRQEADLGFSLK